MSLRQVMPDHQSRNFMGLLSLRSSAVVFIAFVCLALTGFEITSLWQSRRENIRNAERTTETLARSVARSVEDSIRAVDAVLAHAAEQTETAGDNPAALKPLLSQWQTQVDTLPGLVSLAYLDRGGESLIHTPGRRTHLNLTGEDYIEAHRNDDDIPHIGRPVQDEVYQTWVIPLSRRVNRRDGSFGGVVVAMFDTGRLQAFFDTLDIGTDGAVLLARADGALLSRRPFDAAHLGRDIQDMTLFQALAFRTSGAHEVASPTDGVRRIGSYRKLDAYPLVVAVGLSHDEVLTAWRDATWQQTLMAAILVLIVAALGWRLIQQVGLCQRAEREAADAAENYRHLADISRDMVFTLDLNLVRRYASPAIIDLLGYAPEEWITAKAEHAVHPDDITRTKAIWHMMTAGLDRATLETRLQHRDGHWVWIEASMRLIRDAISGKPVEIFGTARDITDRKDAEEALRNARSEAERAAQAKADILAAISHDLHEPMHGILNVSQSLANGKLGPLTAQQAEAAQAIIESGKYLQHLVDDTVALNRAGPAKIALNVGSVEILPLMKAVGAILKPQAKAGNITLDIGDCGAGLPMILADRTRLAQVLINFGSNAIKYNRPAGILRFGYERLDDNWVRLTATVSGGGIPEHMHAQLIESADAKQSANVTSLGLPLIRKLVQLMDGRTGFTSDPYEDSQFWIDMPVDATAAAAALPATPVIARKAPPPDRLILYIGQSSEELLLMRHIVNALPSTSLLEAQDGAIGLAMAALRRPEVIMVESELSDTDGLAVLAQLKKIPDMTHVPVLALTTEFTPRSRLAGFFRVLSRPLDIPKLLTALEVALAESGQSDKTTSDAA